MLALIGVFLIRWLLGWWQHGCSASSGKDHALSTTPGQPGLHLDKKQTILPALRRTQRVCSAVMRPLRERTALARRALHGLRRTVAGQRSGLRRLPQTAAS